MTTRAKSQPPRRHAEKQEKLPDPVDIHDGIPDRCERPARWKLLLIGVLVAAWLSFLIYCAAAGNV